MLRDIHITLAIISGLLFVSRGGYYVLTGCIFDAKVLRILPHLVDTGLLVSAILLYRESVYHIPDTGWLTLKLLFVVCYIILGVVLMRFSAGAVLRILLFSGALICYACIVCLAIYKPVILGA